MNKTLTHIKIIVGEFHPGNTFVIKTGILDPNANSDQTKVILVLDPKYNQ